MWKVIINLILILQNNDRKKNNLPLSGAYVRIGFGTEICERGF